MNDIKVGEYIRTKNGIIFKATEYWVSENLEKYMANPERYTITNHSHDLIYLIEVRRLRKWI